ncbi:hypothetical protein Tco_0061147 [Tanacetum coccineum]
MANLLPRLQELATAVKSTMMVDQVLVLTEKEIDKELKLEVKFRDLCSELVNTVKNKAKYIEKLKRPYVLQLERSRIKQISYEEHYGFNHLSIQHLCLDPHLYH